MIPALIALPTGQETPLLLRFESAVYIRKCGVTFGAAPTIQCCFENSPIILIPRKAGETTRTLRRGPAQTFSYRPSRKKPGRQLHLVIGGDLWSRLEKLFLLSCFPTWKLSPCLDTTHMQLLKTVPSKEALPPHCCVTGNRSLLTL